MTRFTRVMPAPRLLPCAYSEILSPPAGREQSTLRLETMAKSFSNGFCTASKHNNTSVGWLDTETSNILGNDPYRTTGRGSVDIFINRPCVTSLLCERCCEGQRRDIWWVRNTL